MWRAHVASPATPPHSPKEMSKKKKGKHTHTESRAEKIHETEKRKTPTKFQRKLNFGLLAFLLCALNAESGTKA